MRGWQTLSRQAAGKFQATGMHTAGMTSNQRWIGIIALGAGSWATASAVTTWLNQRNSDGGWFNYAPDNGAVFTPSPRNPWEGLLVWLIAIIAWFGISYLALRKPEDRE